MDKKYKLAAFLIVPVAVTVLVLLVMPHHWPTVLSSQGVVARNERNLMIFGALLSSVVVAPVFVLTFWVAWRYRAENPKAKYSPDWDRSRKVETIWWTVPLALITILTVVTWKSSHDLDPFRALPAAGMKPLVVQVVALQWKWLFIYPEQQVASVNQLVIPVDRPVRFQITSDAPMNSFWIPQLGGQIYAMSGMSTELNLMADQPGDYQGVSANISGAGFAGMRFAARALAPLDFDRWVALVQRSSGRLSQDTYNQLARPNTKPQPVVYFARPDPDLYTTIVMKYMTPTGQPQGEPMSGATAMEGMH